MSAERSHYIHEWDHSLLSSLQMYVELYGDESQSNDYPAEVYLRLRHMSASYFRDGNDTIQEFRQPLGSMRKFEFNRFAITDIAKCNEKKMKGNSK